MALQGSGLLPAFPRLFSGSDFSPVFKNQIKFVLIHISADPEQRGGPAVRSAPVSQRF